MLVVEFLSLSTRRHDRGVKTRCYAALAIPHYWIVDPEGKWIACYRLAGDTYRHLSAYEGDVQLVPEDWPDLIIALAGLWR